MPILMLYGDECEYALKALGMTTSRASDDNNPDKELQNIQNFISQGVNGLAVQGAGATVIPQISSEAMNAKVPFVMYNFPPRAEFYDDMSANNPYFAGAVVSDLVADGRILGERAIADGHKTACLIGGNIGDPNMDSRSGGFKEAFEAGGGTIVAEERCNDNSECLTKAPSMFSANRDVNCVYIMVSDYIEGTMTALDTLGITTCDAYLSAANTIAADYIRDGRIVAASGGTALSCNVGPTLLVNMLDGHVIRDADGKAPFIRIPTSIVTAANIDNYISAFFGEGSHAVSEETIKKLCYRYNPDVTYQTYLDVIANDLTVDAILKAKGF
jgi:ABC-type sugar transport system substrate-binding protein